jgi:hypothetical protein
MTEKRPYRAFEDDEAELYGMINQIDLRENDKRPIEEGGDVVETSGRSRPVRSELCDERSGNMGDRITRLRGDFETTWSEHRADHARADAARAADQRQIKGMFYAIAAGIIVAIALSVIGLN